MQLGAASALGVDTDPIAIEATPANARRNRLARRIRAREGSLPSGRARRSTSSSPTSSPGVLVPLAGALRDELRPGGTLLASGIFVDREAEVRDGVRGGRAARHRAGRPRATGSRSRPSAPAEPRARPYNRRRCPPASSRILLVAHITLAISLVLPSILLPFALRTRRATVESDSRVVRGLLWAQTHGTVVIGLGLALTGLGLVAIARLGAAPAAVAARSP